MPRMIRILAVASLALLTLQAQDNRSPRQKLAAAQAQFDARNYEECLASASQLYQEVGDDMGEPGGIAAGSLLLVGNAYAAMGDFRTAELSFKVLSMKARNPVDKAVGKEAATLMGLVAAERPGRKSAPKP